MPPIIPKSRSAIEEFQETVKRESERFQQFYLWLEEQMPQIFYEEISRDYLILIAHTLMGFHLQDYFTILQLGELAFVLCNDSPDADLKILKNFSMFGIKNYQAYVSKTAPPVPGMNSNLRLGAIFFTESIDAHELSPPPVPLEQLKSLVKQRNPTLTDEEFDQIISAMSVRFLRSLSIERFVLAFDMFFRAKTRDPCQYEVRYNEDWQDKASVSMQIVLAWRNTPKSNFLYTMARLIHRHGLIMQRVNTAYINPYSKDGILVMALGLHGSNGKPTWDVADILDFLREFVTIKYFDSFDVIDKILVSPGIVSGNMGNMLRAMVTFIHQILLQLDQNLFTQDSIIEALCRHPELTSLLCEAFRLKFDPWNNNYENYLKVRKHLINNVNRIDTGNEENDTRRKNIFLQGINFIHYSLKTNFYRLNPVDHIVMHVLIRAEI